MKTAVFVFLFSIAMIPVVGQQPSVKQHRGVELFDQGKFSDAIRELEAAGNSAQHRANPDVWNYLGLAYTAEAKFKKSRGAFEKAVQLAPQNSVFRGNLAYAYLKNGQKKKAAESAAEAIRIDPKNPGPYEVRGTLYLWEKKLDLAAGDADTLISLSPSNPNSYLLKSDILMAILTERVAAGSNPKAEVGLFTVAVEALKLGAAQTKGRPGYDELVAQLATLVAFQEHYTKLSQDPPAEPDPGITPVKIVSKPQASYTDAARAESVQGTVRLVIVLGASGRVEHILVLRRLGYGLDQEAIAAARRIRFVPKLKDGKPVPAVITIDYSFSIY